MFFSGLNYKRRELGADRLQSVQHLSQIELFHMAVCDDGNASAGRFQVCHASPQVLKGVLRIDAVDFL